MDICQRCKRVSYCSRSCQIEAWRVHKRWCTLSEVEPSPLPHCWGEVAAFGGEPAPVRLKLRVVRVDADRCLVWCRDREDVVICVELDAEAVQSLQLSVGDVVSWKRPRYDGSGRAHISVDDLQNVRRKPSK